MIDNQLRKHIWSIYNEICREMKPNFSIIFRAKQAKSVRLKYQPNIH